MKPKNVKERRNSFLKFLLLFLVTVGVIITAIFFTFKVPSKENDLLKSQAKRIKKEITFQNNFSSEMASVKRLIDSLDTPGVNLPFQNNLISKKLVDMQKMIPTKDSTYKYDMYTQVVSSYVELQETKGRLSGLKDTESTIIECKEALDKYKEDYKELERLLYLSKK